MWKAKKQRKNINYNTAYNRLKRAIYSIPLLKSRFKMKRNGSDIVEITWNKKSEIIFRKNHTDPFTIERQINI